MFYNYYEVFYAIGIVVAGLIVLGIIMRVAKSLRKRKISSGMTANHGFFGMRGRTSAQKKVIKYFNSSGILSALFRISHSTFDDILNSKVRTYRAQIGQQALTAHGIDADEIREIQPILVENCTMGNYFKMFRDRTFRTSEYQMSCMMFSDTQIYVYSCTFDLTNENTTLQTREYFYKDITNVDVTHKRNEYPDPRPLSYLYGGIACFLFGLIMFAAVHSGVGIFFGICGIVAGIFLTAILGYTRSVVSRLILRVTVPGDEFTCAMKAENMRAVQGMKAKIREKKK